MPVKIHGRDYHTVAERVAKFREDHPLWAILTEILSIDDERIVVRADIADENNRCLSTGYAEEVRSASSINRTSALEVCETSAVGRALSFLGFAGTEIASADEVAAALKAQSAQELLDYNALVREYWDDVAEVKQLLKPMWGEREDQPNVTDARAVLKDLGDELYRKLWKAPTKGGCFTTTERTLLKQPEKSIELFNVEAL